MSDTAGGTIRGALAWRPALTPAMLGAGVATVAVGGLTVRASQADYALDAGPALHALTTGHVGRALELQPLMGTFSILVRAPFALAASLAGAGETGVYRAGVVPCLAALAVVGVALARRGSSFSPLALLLAVATPATLYAVRGGHPEEALGAALVVGAALLADRRWLWSAVLLGLALATKQWAVLAAAPIVWAAPSGRRLRFAAVALAVAAVLTVPLAASPGALRDTSHNAATSPRVTARATVWFLAADRQRIDLHLGKGLPSHVDVYRVPGWVARGSHPLIVLVSPLLMLAFWRRRATRADLLALLSLVFLLRCVLDPVDNEYYHLPFLLSLLAFERVANRDRLGVPPATLFSAAGLWITFDVLDRQAAPPTLTNAVYLAWTGAVLFYLAHALWRPRDRADS